jgi:hypothetical protein
VLLGGQIVVGRRELWLPEWVLRRSVDARRFSRASAFLRPLARRVDSLFRPRLRILTGGGALRVIAGVCVLMALGAPLMEILPFTISAVGLAVSIFGLAILFHDGLLALLAFAACTGIAATGLALIF